MEWLKLYYHLLSVGFICLMITSAHLAASRQYSWTQNTISDLGAQGYSRNWIMRLGFLGFGAIMITGILFKIMDGQINYLIDSAILLYSFAVMSKGVFSSAPFTKGVPYSETTGILHSVFAMTAAFGIGIALLMSALLADNMQLRITHVIFMILVILTSGLFGFRKKIDGVVQRLMYITTFVWLVFFYNM